VSENKILRRTYKKMSDEGLDNSYSSPVVISIESNEVTVGNCNTNVRKSKCILVGKSHTKTH
jgi:hypothetical protein